MLTTAPRNDTALSHIVSVSVLSTALSPSNYYPSKESIVILAYQYSRWSTESLILRHVLVRRITAIRSSPLPGRPDYIFQAELPDGNNLVSPAWLYTAHSQAGGDGDNRHWKSALV